MAGVTQNRVGFMSLMTLRALNIAALCYMVVVRIFVIIFRSFGNRVQRFVAGEAGFSGRGRFGLRFFMTPNTGDAVAFVAISGKAIRLLFTDNSAYAKASNQDQATKNLFKHPFYSFPILGIRNSRCKFHIRPGISNLVFLYTKSIPAKCKPTIRPKATQRPWLKPGNTVG
jgi:hypothetical protein